MSVSARVCPICARAVAPRVENKSFPFCSSNCKLVDLGRWLDGSYRMPAPDEDGETGIAEGRGGDDT